MTSIFSNGPRLDESAKRNTESIFQFLNRSANPDVEIVRDRIDLGLKTFPSGPKAALISRLRSKEEHQFESASFELILYQILLRTGNKVLEIEPNVEGGRTPDFLLKNESGIEYFLEATVERGESSQTSGAKKRLKDFFDGICGINSPRYSLSLATRKYPCGQVSTNRARLIVQPWVDEIPSELSSAKGVEKQFSVDGFEFSLRVIGLRPSRSKRPIGTHSLPSYTKTPGSGIRDVVREKGRRYKDLQMPFVIAINSLEFGGLREELEAALLGSPALHIRRYTDGRTEDCWGRNSDGALVGKLPSYRNISAVTGFEGLSFWSLLNANALTFHNPWAAKPLSQDVFKFKQFYPNFKSEELEPIEGSQLGALMEW